MRLFVFRNSTLEPFFPAGTEFSGYGDIESVPAETDSYLWFWTFPQDIAAKDARKTAASFLDALEIVVSRVPEGKIFRIVELTVPVGMPISASDTRVADAVEHYNSSLRKIVKKCPACAVVSVPAKIFRNIDWRFYFIGQIPFSPNQKLELIETPESEIPRKNTVPAIRKKCLVLDMDGTLWGGILGEDGASGIRIGGDYPGNAFLFFQKKLLELSESGIVLALASKNNLADVDEVFEKNPFMLLRREHFSAIRIGWEEKSVVLREIAKELNLNLDSFVFVDNESRERELIRQLLPEVSVPEFPAHPYELPDFFEMLADNFFRTETLTAEDLDKTAQYHGNAQRALLEQKSATFEDYLKSLDTELTIALANEWTFPRLAQLTQKTNQFNLTTRRRSEAELQKMATDGAKIFSLAVKDRFGDCGIVGLAIFLPELGGNALKIDTFLLSCRVLGRGIENEFLQTLLKRFASAGTHSISAEYIPSAKNSQTANFYLRNGFQAVAPRNFRIEI